MTKAKLKNYSTHEDAKKKAKKKPIKELKITLMIPGKKKRRSE